MTFAVFYEGGSDVFCVLFRHKEHTYLGKKHFCNTETTRGGLELTG